MGAFLVIFADVIADQIEHIKCLFSSIFVNYSDLMANILPILLPISMFG